jgi:hypothetical protein
MVVKLNARLEGAAALFTELVTLEWDGPCILMRGRSGDYIANGHMTPQFAVQLYERLGDVLAQHGAPVTKLPKSRRRKKKR